MRRNYNKYFERYVSTLMPGEYYVSTEAEIISTVLGSRIAACIFDPVKKIGGMNHFMLPGCIDSDRMVFTQMGRYGMYAMELLIGDLINLGVKRSDLKAKIFGGAKVLNFSGIKPNRCIPESNIEFAKTFFNIEQIPITAMDTGGEAGRKLFFFSDTGLVLLKKLCGDSVSKAVKQDIIYRNRLLADSIDTT